MGQNHLLDKPCWAWHVSSCSRKDAGPGEVKAEPGQRGRAAGRTRRSPSCSHRTPFPGTLGTLPLGCDTPNWGQCTAASRSNSPPAPWPGNATSGELSHRRRAHERPDVQALSWLSRPKPGKYPHPHPWAWTERLHTAAHSSLARPHRQGPARWAA